MNVGGREISSSKDSSLKMNGNRRWTSSCDFFLISRQEVYSGSFELRLQDQVISYVKLPCDAHL